MIEWPLPVGIWRDTGWSKYQGRERESNTRYHASSDAKCVPTSVFWINALKNVGFGRRHDGKMNDVGLFAL